MGITVRPIMKPCQVVGGSRERVTRRKEGETKEREKEKEKQASLAWKHMPIIPALGRRICGIEANLGSTGN